MPTIWYHLASISPVSAHIIGINAMLKNWVIAIHIVKLATDSVFECDLINGTDYSTVYVITVFMIITKIEIKVGA